jgi:murein DD-endopeptidase MepM/ murein hydrolase activator NlpD
MGWIFSAPLGTEIYATANGHVRSAELAGPYGNRVIIDHGMNFQPAIVICKNALLKKVRA